MKDPMKETSTERALRELDAAVEMMRAVSRSSIVESEKLARTARAARTSNPSMKAIRSSEADGDEEKSESDLTSRFKALKAL